MSSAIAVHRLRQHRAALLIIIGLALIVAGAWTVAASLFGAAVGAGVGLVLAGVALLVIEGLGAEDTP
jgi:membrane-bound ClpP family serine protease